MKLKKKIKRSIVEGFNKVIDSFKEIACNRYVEVKVSVISTCSNYIEIESVIEYRRIMNFATIPQLFRSYYDKNHLFNMNGYKVLYRFDKKHEDDNNLSIVTSVELVVVDASVPLDAYGTLITNYQNRKFAKNRC